MNTEDKKKIKIGVAISAFTVIFYLGLQNITVLLGKAMSLVTILNPVIYGICLAFILNIIMNLLEKKAFAFLDKKNIQVWNKAKRPICLVLTLVIFLASVPVLMAIIIPQLTKSISELAPNIPSFINSFTVWSTSFLSEFGVSEDVNHYITDTFASFSSTILTMLSSVVPIVISKISAFTTSIVDAVMGFIFAVYMLSQKEDLILGAKKIVYAYIPKQKAKYISHIYHVTVSRFTGFVSGQLAEALILGLCCFVGMLVFRFDYAVLISTLVGLLNMIPMIGPMIGMGIGALILLMIDPSKAFWFLIFSIVLQQIESNLIYPRVVGGSIGLPGLWVIFAIVVGGGLFGLVGIVLGVPTFAVIYALFTENVQANLKKKGIRI